MDDIVRKAMAKWPHVPHCFGWLGLDARGNWYLRDDRTQALGSFSSGVAGAKGSLLTHDKLIEFIQRNYSADQVGQWFFQNGPQRVYVELEATPYVWRVSSDFAVKSHTGSPAQAEQCLLDEQGRVYLECRVDGHNVLGLVHTQDVWGVAQAVEQGHWTPREISSADLPRLFNYVASPATRGLST